MISLICYRNMFKCVNTTVFWWNPNHEIGDTFEALHNPVIFMSRTEVQNNGCVTVVNFNLT